jgi:hypothetical protein
MAARANNMLWLAEISKIFFSETNELTEQWDDDEVRFVLDQHAELDSYIGNWLTLQSANRHVVPLGRIILIPYQPVFARTH